MWQSAKYLVSMVGLLLLVGNSGCGGGSSSTPIPASPITSVLKQTGDLQFTLTTPKTTYARGEAVPFTFTLKNVGTQPVDVVTVNCFIQTTVSKAGQMVDIFPYANGDTFANTTLAPGASTSETDTWNQTDTNNQPVAAGQYALSSYLPIDSLNGTMLVQPPPSSQWFSFWQANYATLPITITIR